MVPPFPVSVTFLFCHQWPIYVRQRRRVAWSYVLSASISTICGFGWIQMDQYSLSVLVQITFKHQWYRKTLPEPAILLPEHTISSVVTILRLGTCPLIVRQSQKSSGLAQYPDMSMYLATGVLVLWISLFEWCLLFYMEFSWLLTIIPIPVPPGTDLHLGSNLQVKW